MPKLPDVLYTVILHQNGAAHAKYAIAPEYNVVDMVACNDPAEASQECKISVKGEHTYLKPTPFKNEVARRQRRYAEDRLKLASWGKR